MKSGRELSNLHFLDKASNIVFVGPPGVGKTHLAIALGIEVAKKRRRVLFISALDLVNQLSAQDYSNMLRPYLDALSRLDLLIIDELGYFELDKNKANLFFKLISKRCEKSSIIITNKPSQECG
ncbi:MAG: ATP-binding protein [Desulfurella sp.]|uniref:ATP-binding protein n=1 Tax=Desulfurella sp. TaxID=1962857 RepID=UPI003D14A2EE